jgi:tetratricopeptide (TPR) repeat protein
MWGRKKKDSDGILLHQEAVALQQRGRFKEAEDRLQKAVKVFRATKNESLLASSLNQLGQVHLNNGNVKESARCVVESATLRTKLLDYKGLAIDYQLLGTLMMLTGQMGEANRYFQDSLGIAISIGNHSLIASAESNLGIVAFELGAYAEAERHFHVSQELRTREGDRLGMAKNLNHLGKIEEALGRPDEASDLYRESLSILRELGAPEAKIALDNLTRLQSRRQ